MLTLRLYSPVNFVIGLQVWFASRAHLSPAEALQEAQDLSPRWPYRLGASILTGVLVLYALFAVLPRTAEPAMMSLGQTFTGKQAALGIGLLIGAAFAALAFKLLRRSWRFYAAMCRLGYAERQHDRA